MNFCFKVMKRKIGITLFLALSAIGVDAQVTDTLQKQSVTKVDTLTMADLMELLDTIPDPEGAVVPDTATFKKPDADSTGNQRPSMEDMLKVLLNDSVIIDTASIKHLKTDSLSGDSISIDTLLMDSLATDSLRTDSLVIDSLATDSISLDSLAVDSLLQQPLLNDTLKKNSVPLKPAVVKKKTPQVNPVVTAFKKEMARLHANYFAYFKLWDNIYLPAPPVRPNGDYYKLSVPATFYSNVYEDLYGLEFTPQPKYSATTLEDIGSAALPCPDVEISKKINRAINGLLMNVYINYPDLVTKNEEQLANMKPLETGKVERQPEVITSYVKSDYSPGKVVEKDLLVIKPNFWTTVGNGYLQLSQTYLSDNWYKGGESSNALAAGLTLKANYDDKQRIQFENMLEWKLGFISTPSDTVHQYRPNTDFLRISSKFGFKAVTNWYYTVSMNFKTQLFSQFTANTDNLVSTFLSPSDLNVGVGMDYKLILDEKLNLSVLMNPLSYTLYSVWSDRVDPTKFNIKAGHKTENFWGSSVQATMKWRIITPILWETRFVYNTNYKKVLAEWENTFTFSFNKFWSAKLFVHGRFDDGVPRKEDHGYFQLQETLSLGLNYIW